jgi:DNA-binding MarR family transcriptional regulator
MAAPIQGSGQALRFSSPQEEALLTLMRVSDHLHRAMQQRLKPSGLTATQYNVLRILRGARPTGLTCSAIGSRMITSEPDITRLLGRLKTQKLVCQQRDAHDRRVVWTHITEKGLDLLTGLDELIDQAPRELLKELTGAELQECIRLLKKIQGDPGIEPAEHQPPTGKRPLPGSPHRHPLG